MIAKPRAVIGIVDAKQCRASAGVGRKRVSVAPLEVGHPNIEVPEARRGAPQLVYLRAPRGPLREPLPLDPQHPSHRVAQVASAILGKASDQTAQRLALTPCMRLQVPRRCRPIGAFLAHLADSVEVWHGAAPGTDAAVAAALAREAHRRLLA